MLRNLELALYMNNRRLSRDMFTSISLYRLLKSGRKSKSEMRCSDPTTITVSRKLATRALCGDWLIVRGLITDKAEVLAEWERHFQELSTFQSQAIFQIAKVTKKKNSLSCNFCPG